jgi:hypothetical protein
LHIISIHRVGGGETSSSNTEVACRFPLVQGFNSTQNRLFDDKDRKIEAILDVMMYKWRVGKKVVAHGTRS